MQKTHGFSLTPLVLSSMVVGALSALTILAFAGMAHADSLPGIDVHIGAGGNAQVEGAKVTAVSGSDVSANTSFGSSVMNWLVKTDGNTEFAAKGGVSGLANIAVGDVISFRGAIDQSVSGLTVKAKAVKDWSKTQAKAHIEGTVSAINTSLNSFTVVNGNATTSVQTGSSTKFSVNGKTGGFADLFLNAKVRLMGMFNASSTIFSATAVDVASTTKSHKDDDHDGGNGWMRGWFRGNFWVHFWNH